LFTAFSFFFIPRAVFAAEIEECVVAEHWTPGCPIVPCGYEYCVIAGCDLIPCDFNALIKLANNIMDLAFYISVPIAAIAFSWAGFLYITAGGNSGRLGKAHEIFTKVGIGFIIVLSSWLIVSTIINTLIPEGLRTNFSLLENPL
jgi:hypothetical protein